MQKNLDPNLVVMHVEQFKNLFGGMKFDLFRINKTLRDTRIDSARKHMIKFNKNMSDINKTLNEQERDERLDRIKKVKELLKSHFGKVVYAHYYGEVRAFTLRGRDLKNKTNVKVYDAHAEKYAKFGRRPTRLESLCIDTIMLKVPENYARLDDFTYIQIGDTRNSLLTPADKPLTAIISR